MSNANKVVAILREGWRINNKRVYRLYRHEGLNLGKTVGRKKISISKQIYADLQGIEFR